MAYLAAFLNFIFPGAGYLVLRQKIPLALAWLTGVIGLTYVEQLHQWPGGGNLQAHDSTAFGVMFAAVFVMNTAFAVDAWKLAKSMETDAVSGTPQTA